jgi:hypothetical protein
MAKRTTGKGRTSLECAKLIARRTEVFLRWRAGEKMRQIADSLRISTSTVNLDCQLAMQEWRESHRGSINETLELEWQLLNWAQLEFRQAWEASKEKGPPDPRYLAEFVKTGAERRKLLGVDKPAKMESQTTVEVNMASTTLTIEQLKDKIRLHYERLQARQTEAKDG